MGSPVIEEKPVIPTLEFSDHAREQAAKRNIAPYEAEFIVDYGEHYYRRGAVHYRMLGKRMPDDLAGNDRLRRLEDAIVLLCPCREFVITLYWKQGKENYSERRRDRARQASCPCCGRPIK